MGKYILRRIILLVPTVIGMSLLIFLMVRLMPADIVDALVGVDPTITPEAKAALRHSFGLDDPIPVQYLRWVSEALQGNLGQSFRTREPITKSLMASLPI